ncbi:DNA primase TraC [Serratia fonticola]|uniref:LPD7 domain-containing protein n=1 Tax=Serratia fonticola TaxID=47917 RepID=UPI002178237C|nr:LPD7 domain-containing protein [Serratia fonticola]CAI2043446.1 DNA primase TraC [Serratia fonticola]
MGKVIEHRLWLAVLHEERDKARKAAGLLDDGRSALAWDKDAVLWYARPGSDIDRVKAWLPDNTISTGGGDAQVEFHDALTQAGLVVKGLPVMDGKRHRVATLEDKKGQKSGVYRGFLDRRPGGWFINYHRAETEKSVTNWKASGTEVDPVARLHIRAAARQAHDNAERAREANYRRQTAKAQALYDKLPGADTAHPYLVRKGITPTPELRQTQNGALVVPFFNAEGEFRTLQYITPDGDKRLYSDAPKQGNFLVVGGPLLPDAPVMYAEGYATARSLNLATGQPVVMTIDAGNMAAIANVLHARYPNTPHIFLADLDHAKKVNKGLLMATQAASSVTYGAAIVPDFTNAEKKLGLTDFNDLHQSRGLDGLRLLVTANIARALEIIREERDKMNLPSEGVSPPTPEEPMPTPVDAMPPIPAETPSFQGDIGPVEAVVDHIPVVDEMPIDINDYASWAAQAETSTVPLPGVGTEPAEIPEVSDVVTPSDDAPISLAGRLNPEGRVPEPTPTDAAEYVTPTPAAAETSRVTTADTASELKANEPEQENATPASQWARRAESEQTPVLSAVDAIWVGPPRPKGDAADPDVALIDKDALLQRLSWEKLGDNAVLYKLDNEPAFIDRSSRLDMAEGASQSDEKVLAALLTAAQYYRGRIELTGSEAFQEKAIALIARHEINVAMKVPAQQAMLEDARKRLAAPEPMRDAVTGDRVPMPDHPPTSQPATSPMSHPAPAAATQADTSRGEAPAVDHRVVPAMRQQENAAQPDSGISPAIHQSYKAAATGVTGKVLECGTAPFRFEPGQSQSAFIMLRTREGKQTFWGKELSGLLRETRIKPGCMATLTWLGKEAVTVKVPMTDKQGNISGYEDKTAHRNQWSLTPTGGDTVRTGNDEGVKLAAFDASRFAKIQSTIITQLHLDMPPPAAPKEGVYWLRPDGQGSQTPGDVLSAPRPSVDKGAGEPVVSSWSKDGHLDLYLVRSDGPYLQGVVRHQGQYQHVLVTLPGRDDAPPMVFNTVSPEGARPVGCGNGINRSSGQPVPRENIAFKLEGDSQVRIGKLDAPASLPPALHSRLGFDERWRDENTSPKAAPAAAPKAQPGDPRPI